MNSNTMDLMELLVQNPNSLSREDLEKLCEAINRESLDSASVSSTHFHQAPAPVFSSTNTATIPSRQGSAFSPAAVIHSTPKSERENGDSVLTSVMVDSGLLGPAKYINFRPITVTIPQQKIPPISHMACGDGRHTFQHNIAGVPAFTAKNIVSGYGKVNKNGIKTQHSHITAEVDQGVRIATVSGVPENTFGEATNDASPAEMQVKHPRAMMITYPISSRYPSAHIHGGLYGLNRIQSRYTVPCSEQAVATSMWLVENFEENLLTTVPRSVMYQNYGDFCQESSLRPFNQAVFGKMVRSCFPNLLTRRLGVRGQSRYHYAGLGVKPHSKYAHSFVINGESTNGRSNCGSHRGKFGVAANVTIESSEEASASSNNVEVPQTCAHGRDQSDVEMSRKSTGENKKTVENAVSFPPLEDLKPMLDIDSTVLRSFFDFYVAYDEQLLSCITSLNFSSTKEHLQNFIIFLPMQSVMDVFHHPSICSVIRLLDDVMYKKAASELLPDCLASLTTEFKVSIRKFAKSLPQWISETSESCNLPEEVIQTRIDAATTWSDFVRRVTTLCHVAKEARKALKDNSVTKQLLADLETIGIEDTTMQCSWCGNDESFDCEYDEEKYRDIVSQEFENVLKYVLVFSNLLKNHAYIEDYVRELEEIVNQEAGLKYCSVDSDDSEIITDKTREFLMKWALYTSKMLTEITLKTSGSVGTFHLITLLFGDYIAHVIAQRKEKVKFYQRATKVLQQDCNILINHNTSSKSLRNFSRP